MKGPTLRRGRRGLGRPRAVVSAVHLRAGGSPDEAGITLGGEGRSMIYWKRF